MTLSIYRPEIFQSTIYFPRNGRKPYLRYNHCVDVIRFQKRFLAAWNANAVGRENIPGQYNFISRSEDYRTWSAPELLFAGDHCRPSVTTDNQWQPAFINDQDRKLFCAWCDFNAQKTYIAVSPDGCNWENREVPHAPSELEGQVVAFPTNHGLLTAAGALIFPVSFPEIVHPGGVGACRYAGLLVSFDNGSTWQYRGLIQAATYNAGSTRPPQAQRERPDLWEPMIFETGTDRLRLLIRNSGEYDHTVDTAPEHTIFAGTGPLDELHWPDARPISIESVGSRNYAVRHSNGTAMIMNDWTTAASPKRGPEDRFELTLFLAPGNDPELLLPGPRIQPPGGRAFYPNGFIADGKLYCAYTYPDYIQGSVVSELPDFSQPFLLPRDSRPGLEIDDQEIRFTQPEATLGVVPSFALLQQEVLTLKFAFECRVRGEAEFPLLSVGGKNDLGLTLLLKFDPESDADLLILRRPRQNDVTVAERLLLRQEQHVELSCGRTSFQLKINGTVHEFSGFIQRKLALGGLYWPTPWPKGLEPVRNVIAVRRNSIILS